MSAPDPEAIKLEVSLRHGDTLGAERSLCNYIESSGTTGNQSSVLSQEVAASATDTSLDLSDHIDTLTVITIKDRSNVGFKVGLASGGTKIEVAANGVIAFKNGASTPPTLYFDSVSASDKAFLEISLAGSRS